MEDDLFFYYPHLKGFNSDASGNQLAAKVIRKVDWPSRKAKGVVKGGNLTTLVSMIGTPFEPDFKDSILFIEEVNEVPYRVDRLLTQMRLAGKFKGIKALVFGDFTYREFRPPADKSVNPFAMLETIALDKSVPVVCNFPAGHNQQNMAFMLGAVAELDTEAKTLKY